LIKDPHKEGEKIVKGKYERCLREKRVPSTSVATGTPTGGPKKRGPGVGGHHDPMSLKKKHKAPVNWAI